MAEEEVSDEVPALAPFTTSVTDVEQDRSDDVDETTAEPVAESTPAADETEPSEPSAAPEETKPETLQRIEHPKTAKIQVDPNATVKELLENPNCLTSLPVLGPDWQPYRPILYTFRVKTSKTMNLARVIAKPPPFYVQFDHVIAVIWSLFNQGADRNNLGIVQLQWALHFLNTIYTSEGVHPQDVDLCICAIEDHLIELYADLASYPVAYRQDHIGDYRNATSGDQSECGIKEDFSVTYAQMIKRCPDRPPQPESFDDYIMDMDLLHELQKLKKSVGIDNIDLTEAVSKEQAIGVLESWKKEQIERIQGEVQRLHTVEDMMKNVEPKSFTGYTDMTQLEPPVRDT